MRKFGLITAIVALLILSFSLIGRESIDKGKKAMKDEKTRNNEESIDWKAKPESFYRERLSGKQYDVCRKGGTERAFSGEYNNFKQEGTFLCSVCGQKLFDSSTKFDSGTGWPSFYKAINGNVELKEDSGWFMKRVEVKCSRCGSHLGHVFNDGPKPTGKRYCINSVCLNFEGKEKR